MKTKDVIKMLQEADPSGELECCIDNADIFFVDVIPAYWDGCFQTIGRDENNKIQNVTIHSQGDKVIIHYYHASDIILDRPDLPVYYDSEYSEKHCKPKVEAAREKAKRIIKEVDDEMEEKTK